MKVKHIKGLYFFEEWTEADLNEVNPQPCEVCGHLTYAKVNDRNDNIPYDMKWRHACSMECARKVHMTLLERFMEEL